MQYFKCKYNTIIKNKKFNPVIQSKQYRKLLFYKGYYVRISLKSEILSHPAKILTIKTQGIKLKHGNRFVVFKVYTQFAKI